MKLGQWPVFAQDEIDAATQVLSSGRVNYWTGNQGKLFEQELASRFKTHHALTLANGTVALELALKALDIGPGDEVIVTPRSYFASVGAVLGVGAKPLFADVDRDSQNLTAATIEESLTPKTKAILLVHLGGWPCDMHAISALATQYNLLVIEDCAQAHGAQWCGQPVGSFSDVAALSFCQDKIVTTAGEGGALLAKHSEVFDIAWSLREDGKNRQQTLAKRAGGTFHYLRERIGSNLRLSEVQSAVGRIQLTKLDQWLLQRRQFADIYNEAFAQVDALRVVKPPADASHAYYQYYVFLRTSESAARVDRNQLIAKLLADGIPSSVGACGEIYREKPLIKAGLLPQRPLTHAQDLAASSIALPVHPGLTEAQIRWIAERLIGHILVK